MLAQNILKSAVKESLAIKHTQLRAISFHHSTDHLIYLIEKYHPPLIFITALYSSKQLKIVHLADSSHKTL